jgi:hypothetical protein
MGATLLYAVTRECHGAGLCGTRNIRRISQYCSKDQNAVCSTLVDSMVGDKCQGDRKCRKYRNIGEQIRLK